MEVFVKFFIDGSSSIEKHENWIIYTIYKKNLNGFEFVGFVSTYKFYRKIDKFRTRIS